jgi:hypothetical protein
LFNVLPRPDVTLFGIVHKILEAERTRDTEERRAGRRHPYRCTQMVARFEDNKPSGELQFRSVQCIDLSAAGLMYLSDSPPPSVDLVVALGNDRSICLRAQVLRQERVFHEDRFLHQIACRFTGRTVED